MEAAATDALMSRNKKKVAVILLENDAGKILLQHRTIDAPTLPNYWCLFGGHIEDNETPLAAVIRETLEELEYSLTGPRFVVMHHSSWEATDYEIHVFAERYDGSKLVLHEGQGMEWFAPSATADLLMDDGSRYILQKWIEINAAK